MRASLLRVAQSLRVQALQCSAAATRWWGSMEFRAAFPDLNFWGTADLIAEGDYVVGQWEGGGTHTRRAFSDLPIGSLPAASGKKMRFTGTSVLRVKDGLITEELGIDDGVTVL